MLEMAEARKVFLAGVGPGGREETVALVASDLAIESCTGNSFASPCAVAVGSSGALGSGRVTSLASINQSGGDKGKRARAPRSDGSLIVIGRGTGTQAGDAALHKLAAGIARRSIFVDGRANPPAAVFDGRRPFRWRRPAWRPGYGPGPRQSPLPGPLLRRHWRRTACRTWP